MGLFWNQLKGLLYRNALIKIKKFGKETFWEFFVPVFYLGILIGIRAGLNPQLEPSMEALPIYSLNSDVAISNAVSSSLKGTTLAVVPNTDEAAKLGKAIADKHGMSLAAFPSASKFNTSYHQDPSSFGAALLLSMNLATNWTYTIQLPPANIPATTVGSIFSSSEKCRNYDSFNGFSECPVNGYVTSGFVSLMTDVNGYLFNSKYAKDLISVDDVSIQVMSQREFRPNFTTLQIISGIYIPIIFIVILVILVNNLVLDKEKKIKENMKIMGMKESCYWLSWVIVYTGVSLATSLMAFVIIIAGRLITNVNYGMIFIGMFAYSMSVVASSFVYASFFVKAKTATGVVQFVVTIMSSIYVIIPLLGENIPQYGYWLLCLINPLAMSLFFERTLTLSIISPDTITFAMIFDADNPLVKEIGFPPGYALIMLFVDVVLYFLVAAYLEIVLPKEYGTNEHPLFCFNPSYWCRGDKVTTLLDQEEGGSAIADSVYNDNVEQISDEIKRKNCLRMINFTKEFKTTDKTIKAIDELSMEVYESQITALLGHNGAGKSTAINCITGVMSATSGSIVIDKMTIDNPVALSTFRKNIGICPQENILIDQLNAEQHLHIFGSIKGLGGADLKHAVDKILEDVDLTENGKKAVISLSGGQKRKLCLGMAIIGDPRVLILDEPTSGMDPLSRRKIWSLLKSIKSQKIILLTTHFMDEADVLADRKVVISKGHLKCCGSSLFLKRKFGIGYHLILNLDETHDKDALVELVTENVEGAELNNLQRGEFEMALTLPFSEIGSFHKLFTELESENEIKRCGILNYGISMTSLEDVFLKLEEEEELEDVDKDSTANGVEEDNLDILRDVDACFVTDSKRKNRLTFSALMYARWLIIWRHKANFWTRIFFPLLYLVLAMVSIKYWATTSTDNVQTSLALDPKLYPDQTFAMDSLTGSSVQVGLQTKFESFLPSFKEISGLTTGELLESDDAYDFGIYLEKLLLNSSTGLAYSLTNVYNGSAVHSLPILMNVIQNSLQKTYLDAQSLDEGPTFVVSSLPFQNVVSSSSGGFGAVFMGVMISFAFVTLATPFPIDIIKDRTNKIRCSLRTNSVTSQLYWGSIIALDGMNLFIIFVFCLILPFIFSVDAFTIPSAYCIYVFAMLIYMVEILAMVYCFSFAFKDHESAQMLGLMMTFLIMIPYLVVSLIDQNSPGSGTAVTTIHYVALVVAPPYYLPGILYHVFRVYTIYQSTGIADQLNFSVYMDPVYRLNPAVFVALIHTVLLIILLIYLDQRPEDREFAKKKSSVSDSSKEALRKLDSAHNEEAAVDEDVENEKEKIKSMGDKTDGFPIVCQDLYKKYVLAKEERNWRGKVTTPTKYKLAVKGISFVVEKGELFGLLGPNGAGKSTTIETIVHESAPSAGSVYVSGYNMDKDHVKANEYLGYCPQSNPLWEDLTLHEHLYIFGKINGLPSEIAEQVALKSESVLKLGIYRNTLTKKLSGGTKRKLCFALSLLSDPQIQLLDEPSTGLDPESKRHLWSVIKSNVVGRRGAILTTHYMEEAETLCSKIGVMVKGNLKCLGTVQHLKDKYGSGYILEISLRPDCTLVTETFEQIEGVLGEMFPDISKSEDFGHHCVFSIPLDNIKSLAIHFKALEELKLRFEISEYNFSQTTLEQVFLHFAKEQDISDEDAEQANPLCNVSSRKHSMVAKKDSLKDDSSYVEISVF